MSRQSVMNSLATAMMLWTALRQACYNRTWRIPLLFTNRLPIDVGATPLFV
jgi:hypothetical protein